MLARANEIRHQLLEIMKRLKLKIQSCGGKWDTIRKCVCSAMLHNAAKMKGIGVYVNCRTGRPAYLHPSSALYHNGFCSNYVVYDEIMLTTKEYMQCVSAVEPGWLSEFGSKLYSVQTTH